MEALEPTSLRVAHLNTEPTWRGGEQQVLYLATAQAAGGHRPTVFAQPGSPMALRAREAGLPVVELRTRGEADLPAMSRLARWLREHPVDVLHMHTTHAHTIGVVAAWWARASARRVVSKRTDFSIFRHSFLGLNRLKYLHGVDRYIAISEAVRRVLIDDGVPAARIAVVPSGVQADRFEGARANGLRRELGLGEGAPVVGNIAHFADHKGQRYLVEAAPRILKARPEARLLIVGEGALRAPLMERARELGVADRVLFPGFREDVPALLALFDVFVMPSHLEGLGTIVLDALASGTPVVAAAAGGIPEVIEDGRTGLLVAPRDPAALAEGVLALLADPARAAALAEEGRRRVRERFSVEAMVEGTLTVYRGLLGGSP